MPSGANFPSAPETLDSVLEANAKFVRRALSVPTVSEVEAEADAAADAALQALNITQAGLDLLDDVNAAAQRQTLGIADFFGTILGSNGQKITLKQLTELTTIAAAATTDTTIEIPAGVLVVSVSTRVTVAIPVAGHYDVGIAGATTRYGGVDAVEAGTVTKGTNDGMRYYAAATKIRITPDGTPDAATGRVRVTIHYLEITAPTS